MRICIFGDSTTYGIGDTEMGGWVDRLKVFLAKKNIDNIVFNLGISGATSEMLLERMDYEAKPRRPDVIIICLGGNDSSFRKKLGKRFVEPNDFNKNLEKIFKIAKKYTDKIVMVGAYAMNEKKTCPVEWNKDVYYKNNDLKEYNDMVKVFCKENNINFINIFDLDFKDNLIDGVHVNSNGHKKIFKKVKDELIKNNII